MVSKKRQVPKPVRASAIEYYPHTVFPNDLNDLETAFGGKVLDIADRVAGSVAQAHSNSFCVTLLLDSVLFLSPVRRGETLIFKAAVNRVWTTSMEVGVKVLAKNFRTMKERHVFSAYFTFVAVDTRHRPVGIPPVIPETSEEQRRYKDAGMRRQNRLMLQKKKRAG